ncbi:MAG: PP2C family protein-serine/threonine phosphatase [Candidatus Peregrinibacteria bacterium]
MRITIRSKLIMAISVLMVVLFALSAVMFINEKRTEMADDIFVNSLAFSKLTAPGVADNYDLYLEQSGFVYFNREIQSLFEQNDDISGLKVVSYDGDLLYDSLSDVDKKFDGENRKIDDRILEQVRAEYVSFRTLDGDVFYLDNGKFVNREGIEIEKRESGMKVEYFVVPANEKYSVIYEIGYHNLDARVATMISRIIYLALFGILLGVLFSFFMSTSVTKPIHKLERGAEFIAKGDFKARVDIRTNDEIGYLGKTFNKMAEDLEESMEARLYKERVTRELELATEIQQRLIPSKDEIPQAAGLDIAADIIPAAEIGGDMYDFMKSGDDRLLMYIGDVTGHGVPAGIVGSIASAVFYGYSAEKDLKKIMVKANRVLKAKTMSNMFMTLCLMEWDSENGKFSYVSAGHEKLIHYRAKYRHVELTKGGGVALGMVPDISGHINLEEVELERGDFLIAYSDGIPEAWKEDKISYGMERFVKVVERFGDAKSSEIMKNAILEDVKEFCAGHEQMDDMTLIVIKRT